MPTAETTAGVTECFVHLQRLFHKGEPSMRFALAVAAAALLSVATTASAQAGLRGTGVYGAAGCGLGSMVFGNQPGGVQVLAATTNATGIQTFGITTGTS